MIYSKGRKRDKLEASCGYEGILGNHVPVHSLYPISNLSQLLTAKLKKCNNTLDKD